MPRGGLPWYRALLAVCLRSCRACLVWGCGSVRRYAAVNAIEFLARRRVGDRPRRFTACLALAFLVSQGLLHPAVFDAAALVLAPTPGRRGSLGCVRARGASRLSEPRALSRSRPRAPGSTHDRRFCSRCADSSTPPHSAVARCAAGARRIRRVATLAANGTPSCSPDALRERASRRWPDARSPMPCWLPSSISLPARGSRSRGCPELACPRRCGPRRGLPCSLPLGVDSAAVTARDPRASDGLFRRARVTRPRRVGMTAQARTGPRRRLRVRLDRFAERSSRARGREPLAPDARPRSRLRRAGARASARDDEGDPSPCASGTSRSIARSFPRGHGDGFFEALVPGWARNALPLRLHGVVRTDPTRVPSSRSASTACARVATGFRPRHPRRRSRTRRRSELHPAPSPEGTLEAKSTSRSRRGPRGQAIQIMPFAAFPGRRRGLAACLLRPSDTRPGHLRALVERRTGGLSVLRGR